MSRISRTRLSEILAIILVLSIALFINDVILRKSTPSVVPHVVQPTELPDTPMVVPVKEKSPTKKLTLNHSEVECMASVVFHEARGEPLLGQIAVANVVLNRVKSRHYPASVCNVVFQPHQFTDHTKIKYNEKTLQLAKRIMQGAIDRVTDATHYHSIRVMPKWAKHPRMHYRIQIGDHIFYKMG